MPEKEFTPTADWQEDLTKATKDYHLFSAQETPLEAKDFAAYHNACRAALAHILILKKICAPTLESPQQTDFLNLLEQARKATYDNTTDIDSFD